MHTGVINEIGRKVVHLSMIIRGSTSDRIAISELFSCFPDFPYPAHALLAEFCESEHEHHNNTVLPAFGWTIALT